MTLDVRHIMASLSEVRPIFHSAADFQFALAWQVQKRLPASQVRMEFKPFPHEGMYLDIWIRGDTRMAIELKYKTRTLESEQDGELFILRDQSAHDHGRYDFLKDVERLELAMKESGQVDSGFAIMLTNDPLYWDRKRLRASDPNDAAFHIWDGRPIRGELAWSDLSTNSVKGREVSINLGSLYDLNWRDYSRLSGAGNYRRFRYLAVAIN